MKHEYRRIGPRGLHRAVLIENKTRDTGRRLRDNSSEIQPMSRR